MVRLGDELPTFLTPSARSTDVVDVRDNKWQHILETKLIKLYLCFLYSNNCMCTGWYRLTDGINQGEDIRIMYDDFYSCPDIPPDHILVRLTVDYQFQCTSGTWNKIFYTIAKYSHCAYIKRVSWLLHWCAVITPGYRPLLMLKVVRLNLRIWNNVNIYL